MIKKDSVPNPEEVLRQQLDVEKDLHTKGQEEVMKNRATTATINTHFHYFFLVGSLVF